MLNKSEKKLPEFDADVSPQNQVNREAAKARNLTFDKKSGYYRDSDGYLIRDKFGQKL